MNIILFGATGQAGSRILTALVKRGHLVLTVARDPSQVACGPEVTVQKAIFQDQSRSQK